MTDLEKVIVVLDELGIAHKVIRATSVTFVEIRTTSGPDNEVNFEFTAIGAFKNIWTEEGL